MRTTSSAITRLTTDLEVDVYSSLVSKQPLLTHNEAEGLLSLLMTLHPQPRSRLRRQPIGLQVFIRRWPRCASIVDVLANRRKEETKGIVDALFLK